MAYFKDVDHNKQVVFDIETIPLQEGEYPEMLDELITRKLDRAIKANPDIGTAQSKIDAERRKIMATDPFLGQIVCISTFFPHTDTKISLTGTSEKVILTKFWKLISAHNGLFVGFNHVRFDCPFIVRRSMVHRVEPTNGLFLQFNRYDPFPPHFDVMLQLSGREGYIGLKHACEIFGVTSSKGGAVKADSVEEAYKAGKITEIADYCLRDVIATFELFKIIKEYIPK